MIHGVDEFGGAGAGQISGEVVTPSQSPEVFTARAMALCCVALLVAFVVLIVASVITAQPADVVPDGGSAAAVPWWVA